MSAAEYEHKIANLEQSLKLRVDAMEILKKKNVELEAQLSITTEKYAELKDELKDSEAEYSEAIQGSVSLEKRLADAEAVIAQFLKKTEVYLRVYEGDKELRQYRANAETYQKKYLNAHSLQGGKNE